MPRGSDRREIEDVEKKKKTRNRRRTREERERTRKRRQRKRKKSNRTRKKRCSIGWQFWVIVFLTLMSASSGKRQRPSLKSQVLRLKCDS